MKVLTANSENKLPLSINAWKLFNFSDKVEFVQLELKSGEKIEPHKNEVEVFFYVSKGEIAFNVDDKIFDLNENDLFFVEKNKIRSCINNSNYEVVMLVVKVF